MSDRADNRSDAGDDRAAHGERWNADLAAYALDALDPAERGKLEEHLAGCEICRERLHWVQPAVDVLPATVAQQSPPPALKSRIMDVVHRESDLIESAADPGRAARGGERPPRRGFLAGFSLRPVLAGLGVLVLLGAAVAGFALRGDDTSEQPGEVFTAQGERSASPATGRLEVDGDAGMLHVANLPPTRRGEVYQAWIQDQGTAGGTVHPSSVFVVSEDGVGDVAIPHGLAKARRVMITREPKGGSEHPSENSVLTAEMG